MKKIFFAALFVGMLQQADAQNYKFGKVSIEELKEQYYPLDSMANAAYLYKKRKTRTIISGGKIVLETKIHVRLKFYHTKGFNWATESVYLYNNGSKKVQLRSVKGMTYNLIDGQIERTKLDKKNIFSEEVTKNLLKQKFTMPNIKKRTIVEWTYTIYSPFFTNIDNVVVQYKIPVKRYVTEIRLLEWFNFNKRQKGFYAFYIKESKKRNIELKTNDKVILIEENNIPAMIEEPYVNNINNYTTGLELEVASLRAPSLGLYENYVTSWEEIGKDINNSSSFGGELKKKSHLKEDLISLKKKSSTLTLMQKIESALEYVKSKIKWNNNMGKYPEKGVRKAFKEGVGNIGDINLTLVIVLRAIGIQANPVLLSTRDNGIPLFPTSKGINYVIVHVKTEEGYILLDASEEYSAPNILPLRALNWRGILIGDDGNVDFVNLENLLVSSEESILKYKITEDSFIEGMNRTTYKNLKAMNYRKKNGSLDEDKLISNIETANDDIEIINFKLTNKGELSKPMAEMYTFEKEDVAEIIGDKIYFSPLLFLAMDENPFKLETREYPIDFGTPWKEKATVTVSIPEGYKIESIPESIGVGLSDEMGEFIFLVKEVGKSIQIISIIEINNGVIPAQYYAELKGFFKQVVAKQTEQIVLSRI